MCHKYQFQFLFSSPPIIYAEESSISRLFICRDEIDLAPNHIHRVLPASCIIDLNL